MQNGHLEYTGFFARLTFVVVYLFLVSFVVLANSRPEGAPTGAGDRTAIADQQVVHVLDRTSP